jgi:hypothetical protein
VLLVVEVSEHVAVEYVPVDQGDLPHGSRFDLPDPLSGDAHEVPNFLKGEPTLISNIEGTIELCVWTNLW